MLPVKDDLIHTQVKRNIQEYLRLASAPFREIIQIGPFCATFSEGTDNPYLNYAIPDDGASPTPDEVQAFISAYETRGRKPRLEYIPDLAPAVAPALLAAGFKEESRTPLMICLRGEQTALSIPA